MSADQWGLQWGLGLLTYVGIGFLFVMAQARWFRDHDDFPVLTLILWPVVIAVAPVVITVAAASAIVRGADRLARFAARLGRKLRDG